MRNTPINKHEASSTYRNNDQENFREDVLSSSPLLLESSDENCSELFSKAYGVLAVRGGLVNGRRFIALFYQTVKFLVHLNLLWRGIPNLTNQ